MYVKFHSRTVFQNSNSVQQWRSWRQSGSMSTIIPVLYPCISHQHYSLKRDIQVLTATIILGWLLHFVALGRWSELGYFRGFVGGKRSWLFSFFLLKYHLASALYALIFGVLALVPAPRKEKDEQPISRHRR